MLFRSTGTVPPTSTRRLDEATLADLVQNMAGQELGAATFETSLTWRSGATGRLTQVDLTGTLGIEMPIWTRYSSRPDVERREWDRFYGVLLEHERGHISILRREFQTAYARLLTATGATAQGLLERETGRIQGVSDQYDRQTDHGRRQNSVYGTTIIVITAN